MPFIPCEKAPRIYMGRNIPSPEAPGGVVRLGRGDGAVRRQVESASSLLRKHKLEPEQSVYADIDGRVAALQADVLKGARREDLSGIIERVMDMRPFLSHDIESQFPRRHSNSYDFRFDDNHLAPDEPPTAGLILSQQRRKVYDASSRSFFFTISQVMECYMLAVAIMRSEPFNLPAYPATAVVKADPAESEEDGGPEEEVHKPIIAIVDPAKAESLITFNLYPSHPPMGSVEIISDEGMWAVSNAMRAANRVKYLLAEMTMTIQEGKEYPLDEMRARLREISSHLHTCHKEWVGCHFITEVFTLLEESVRRPLAEDMLRSIHADWEGFAGRFPALARSPSRFQAHVEAMTADSAEGIREMAMGFLSERIALDSIPHGGSGMLN